MLGTWVPVSVSMFVGCGCVGGCAEHTLRQWRWVTTVVADDTQMRGHLVLQQGGHRQADTREFTHLLASSGAGGVAPRGEGAAGGEGPSGTQLPGSPPHSASAYVTSASAQPPESWIHRGGLWVSPGRAGCCLH